MTVAQDIAAEREAVLIAAVKRLGEAERREEQVHGLYRAAEQAWEASRDVSQTSRSLVRALEGLVALPRATEGATP